MWNINYTRAFSSGAVNRSKAIIVRIYVTRYKREYSVRYWSARFMMVP